jgi:CRP/FNR family transcriptional regulator, cyclic AMP receptor protein
MTKPSDLRTIPLFSRMTDAHLDELGAIFERRSLKEGEVLFEAGSPADQFQVLVAGGISLLEDGTERFRLAPLAPIGELGALTGVAHNVKAVATKPSEVWRVSVAKLMEFFERHGDVAFPFYQSLLEIVSDKVRRDEHRLEEMRGNIIRTQKTMKRLRELVLESPETELSEPIAKAFDELIEQNRRGHYMVEPARVLATKVRLDDGKEIAVREISEDHVSLASKVCEPGQSWSGVLVLPVSSGGGSMRPPQEIPISGTVERFVDGRCVVKLDLLVEDYKRALADYLTRVQLLDFVV